MNLNDVMTSKEVVEQFKIAESTLRTECKKSLEGKGRFKKGEIRKASGGWLFCKDAIERIYEPRDKTKEQP